MADEWQAQRASCACGEFRVTAFKAPRSMVACHCTDCQKRTGSAFGIGVVFDDASLAIEADNATIYTRISDRGNPVRHQFCPNCGTTLFWRADAYPGIVVVAGGAFNDNSWIRPKFWAFTASAHDWFPFDNRMPRYRRDPHCEKNGDK